MILNWSQDVGVKTVLLKVTRLAAVIHLSEDRSLKNSNSALGSAINVLCGRASAYIKSFCAENITIVTKSIQPAHFKDTKFLYLAMICTINRNFGE